MFMELRVVHQMYDKEDLSLVCLRDVGVGNKSWQRIPNSSLILVGDTFDVEKQPERRYYLVNDNHTFKWVNEALLDEVATLGVQIERLKEEMEKLTIEALQDQKMKFEKMQMEFEKELFERLISSN
ncbi:PREDICTED: uncharacterized protein At4g04775-like [Camelina sativa]|uniref:Uncharacterized protein At4g04775-like n=1 Tax=Camelina sativa TaxID=90675 RepID=A0ABM0Y550_CAMSA|nr:PREDICTED: uncharacterized protein At4g04775-like [Camelina sativa]